MSLFLLFLPPLAFFFLRATVFSGEPRESLRIYLAGLLASLGVCCFFYLTRGLIPAPAENFFSLFHYWYYDYFLWMAGGAALFLLGRAWMAPEGRENRLAIFLLGVLSLSGLATILQRGLPRDSYWVLWLPLLRLCLLLVLLPQIDDFLDERGRDLALLIAKAVGISLIPALFPLLHFWNLWYLSLPLLLACLAAGAWYGKDLFVKPLIDEYDALRAGK